MRCKNLYSIDPVMRALCARVLFFEQVCVGSGAQQKQCRIVLVDLVNQQPIGRYVAFAATGPVPSQRVISVPWRHAAIVHQEAHDAFKFRDVVPAF